MVKFHVKMSPKSSFLGGGTKLRVGLLLIQLTEEVCFVRIHSIKINIAASTYFPKIDSFFDKAIH